MYDISKDVKCSCIGKKKFVSLSEAKDFIKYLKRKELIKNEIEPYKCRHCRRYHLGHKQGLPYWYKNVNWMVAFKSDHTGWVKKEMFSFIEYNEAVNCLREMKYHHPAYKWRMKKVILPIRVDRVIKKIPQIFAK